jgi:hypothetical protein
MTVEFTRQGKTYFCVLGPVHGRTPPERISIAFRPCAYKAPVMLELAYLGRDPARAIELYQPVESDPGED